MAEASNRTKRLVGEIALLVCVTYVWGVRSPSVSKAGVKARVLKHVVKADRDNVDAYRFLADFHVKAGNHKEAAGALEQVVRLQPDDAASWAMLGDIQSARGRHEDALGAYRQVARLHVFDAQAHYQLGDAYLRIGEIDLALQEYEKLKEVDEHLANDLLDRIQDQTKRSKHR